jgi:hypothetical protein
MASGNKDHIQKVLNSLSEMSTDLAHINRLLKVDRDKVRSDGDGKSRLNSLLLKWMKELELSANKINKIKEEIKSVYDEIQSK